MSDPTTASQPPDPGGPLSNLQIVRRTLLVSSVVVGVLAVLWLLSRISSVLFMVFVALFVAVAMEPPVHYLEKKGWRRGAATGLVFVLFVLAAIGFSLALAPLFIDQVTQLVDAIPGYVEGFAEWLNTSFSVEIQVDLSNLEDESELVLEWLQGNVGGVVGSILGIGTLIGGFIFFASTVALFAFYMVADLPKLQRTVLSLMPKDRQIRALRIWEVAVEKMGGYIYSRLIVAVIGGVVTWIFLTALGVPFAVPLAIWVGILSQFVPVVGTYLAAILPAAVALSSKGAATMVWVIVFFVAYQQIENYLIAPRITKRTMAIHPAVSIGSILIGGALLGPIGVLLALPMAGIIIALISESTRRYEVVLDDETGEYDVIDPED